MTADDTEQRYQVIVVRDRARSQRLSYELLRYRRPGEAGPRLERLGELGSPECTQAQALAFAVEWLRLTRPEPVPDYAVEFHWGVTEPDARTVSASGPVLHYARSGRVKWWRRVRA